MKGLYIRAVGPQIRNVCLALVAFQLGSSSWKAAAVQPGDGPPGVVIAHRAASDRIYLGSPSIAKLPDGSLIISHDEFGPRATGDKEYIYRSTDKGRSWTLVATVADQYWSSLFVRGASLYLFGTTNDHGVPSIRRSDDGGHSWSHASDSKSGLFPLTDRYLTGPVPLLVARGRIWRSMEVVQSGTLNSVVFSTPIKTEDLLDTSKWVVSSPSIPSNQWLSGNFSSWMEGNLVQSQSGEILNILRVNYNSRNELSASISVDPSGQGTHFDPKTDFKPIPGAGKKFTIRYDPNSGYYMALTNVIAHDVRTKNYERARNRLSLIYSKNLSDWCLGKDVAYNPNPNLFGYQYADWMVDGADIISAIRVAADDGEGGAHNQHDTNYISFLRLSKYQEYLAGPCRDIDQ